MKRNFYIVSGILFFLGFTFGFSTISCKTIDDHNHDELALDPDPTGGLGFVKEHHSFGDVVMGEKPEAVFSFENRSEYMIKITDLITTCGCTVAELKKYEYAPGEKGEIKVLMDTTLKKGLISKVITLKTDDPKREEVHLSVSVRVLMPPHPDQKGVKLIMSEKCRMCHIDAGKGLTGGYLYHKVCWQCHGDKQHLPSSINLFNKKFLKTRSNEQLYTMISNGDAGNGMPSYLDEEGGRGLTAEQIHSLVEFIRAHENKETK